LPQQLIATKLSQGQNKMGARSSPLFMSAAVFGGRPTDFKVTLALKPPRQSLS
jgi:hypothetical protein